VLTFFTTAKPFRGHSAIIQCYALQSWKALHPDRSFCLVMKRGLLKLPHALIEFWYPVAEWPAQARARELVYTPCFSTSIPTFLFCRSSLRRLAVCRRFSQFPWCRSSNQHRPSVTGGHEFTSAGGLRRVRFRSEKHLARPWLWQNTVLRTGSPGRTRPAQEKRRQNRRWREDLSHR
jgi:hypothetical protein